MSLEDCEGLPIFPKESNNSDGLPAIKQCPFCPSDEENHARLHWEFYGGWVQCGRCEANGRAFNATAMTQHAERIAKVEAIEAWNYVADQVHNALTDAESKDLLHLRMWRDSQLEQTYRIARILYEFYDATPEFKEQPMMPLEDQIKLVVQDAIRWQAAKAKYGKAFKSLFDEFQ